MKTDHLIILGLVGVGAWWLWRQKKATADTADQATKTASTQDYGPALPNGQLYTNNSSGTASDPSGSLVGSNIPFGPAAPAGTGDSTSNTGDYGPKMPDGSMYTSPPIVVDHMPRDVVNT